MSGPNPILMANRIVSLIERAKIGISTEAQAQFDIGQLLEKAGFVFEREAVLSEKDRIDFLVGAIGVEVKTSSSHSRRDIWRQMQRYAESPRVDALILVTGTAWPQSRGKIGEKHMLIASLTKGWIG